MRTSLPVLIACVLVAASGKAQDKDERQVDVPKLINALASENPAPTERSGPDLKFPSGYDRKKQAPVRSAKSQLKALGPAAFKSLIENWGDQRYCLTYYVGINGYMYNATVGEMCRVIVYDQIQPYGIWPETDDDPRGKPKRPSYPNVFLNDEKSAEKWLEEHKDKSLFEIQLMVIDWVIEQESESPKDFTDEERLAMREIREKLVESKKPMTRGNYYMDDYDRSKGRTMACTGGRDRPILVVALVFYSSPVMPVVLRLNPKEYQMSAAAVEPNKWRKRLWRLTITCTLMGISFAIGIAITAFIAFRLLLPIAATGMTMGMIGMASAGAHATTNALYSGDSATRLTVLTQLQQTFDAQPTMTFDEQTSAWILPAIEQCKTDVDPEVVSLAEKLATYVKDNTQPSPQ